MLSSLHPTADTSFLAHNSLLSNLENFNVKKQYEGFQIKMFLSLLPLSACVDRNKKILLYFMHDTHKQKAMYFS